MTTIVTRAGKGSPLTNNEVDANFINLNTDKIEVVGTPTTGQFISWSGTAWVPASSGGGTVTSVDVSGASTGLTFSGGPITSSGTITLGGTLAVGYGGTGATTATGARANLGAAASGANSDITSMSGITGGISSPDFIQFDLTAAATPAIGRLSWNDGDGTLDLGLIGGNVVNQIGQELNLRVQNASGSTINNGQAVRVTGASGNRMTIDLARADADINSATVIGLTTENIANNNAGFITTFGLVRDIDTSALTEGAVVYLSPTTPGGLTTTKPVAPQHMVVIGYCVRSHATVGQIFVEVQNGYELEELHNVLITTPVDKNVISYEAATGLWKNTSVTTALGFTPENSANKGVAGGYASLDGTGKVPSTQLPSYVDDVVEYANQASFPASGSTGIIYVALDTNKIYRWSGSAYVEISPSPGSTDSVPEGSTNLYYTTSRARSAISASGSLSYNTTTGVVSYTQPTNVSAFTNDVGYLTGITSGNVTTALGYTPANKAGDTFAGAVGFVGGSAVAANGDFYARRSGGNTGVYYFVDGGDKYLYWDGVQYLYGGSYTVAASRFYGVNDVRAPIFYDSDNTAYFVDPNSTSVMSTVRASAIQFSNGNTAISLADSSYQVLRDPTGRPALYLGGADTANYYDNDAHYFRNRVGSQYATIAPSGAYAAVFYDFNDTAYYVNPNGASALNSVSFGSGPIYGGGGGQIVPSPGSPYSLRQDFGSDNSGWRYGIAKNVSGTATVLFYVQDNGAVVSLGDMRAPIFYDSNNTNFYVNPDDDTNLSAVRARGQIRATGWWGEPYSGSVGGLGIEIGRSGGTSYVLSYNRDASTYGPMQFEATSFNFANVGGSYVTVANSVRAPIFYDSDNTGWYLDPASTSSLNNLNVNGSTVYPAQWTTRFQSSSDFPNGTLVTTDIPATAWAGDSFIIEITGKSYDGGNPPFKVVAQGYLYNDTIINYSGINYGGSFSSYIKVFQDGGVLKFWWPRISYWNSFNVNVMGMDGPSNNTITRNRVTAITDSTEPTGTKKVQINLNQALRENAWIGSKYFGSDGAIYGTIFHDTNNSAYYCDPASTSNINALVASVGTFTNNASSRVLYLKGSGNIIQFQDADGTDRWENVGRNGTYYVYKNYGTGSGFKWQIDDSGNHTFNGIATFNTDVRTPIFYDSNDTGYYCDPNYISQFWRINAVDYIYTPSDVYGRRFIDVNDQSFLLDPAGTSVLTTVYARKTVTNSTPAIEVRGGAGGPRIQTYGLDANGAAWMGLGTDMGGTSYEHSVYFPYGSSGEGRLSIGDYNGTTYNPRLWVYTSYTQINNSVRSPLFYDSDNTGYYVDAAGNSVFNTLYASNIVGNYGWVGYPGIDANAYTHNAVSGFTYSNNAPYNGPFVALPASGYGLQLNAPYNGGAALSFRTRNGDTSTFNSWYSLAVYGSNPGAGNLYAAIYYDPSNTGYYTRPAGSSYIYEMTAANTIYSNGWFRSYGDTGWYSQTYGGGIYMTDGTYVRIYGGKEFYASNIITSASSVRAPIFYDSQNTNYYLDPTGESVLGTITLIGELNLSASGINYIDHSGTIYFRNQSGYATSATLTTGGDFTASGNVTAYSDARLKDNVETVSGALDLVSAMRGVTYTRKDTGSEGVGVIAQEMLEVIPQVVQQGEDGTLSVAYGNLVGVLIEAIKELKTEVETLKTTVH